ncbi:ABC transporter permease [Paenibacillus riograndensis]|uniref:Putative membrane protein n=2 Tax=Paenibacillus riograndensis TaxID=483937 RepID=A0A0E3WJ62_9BACL|nr:ABC transporter permease [Paenibacillus riograndensis]CQR58233.1 putative membrane protein [Paenibacillus riograndensis SBR5]
MRNFISLELKKIRNKNTVIISLLFLTIILIPWVQTAQSIDVLDDEGNIHSGLGGWQILRERTVEGTMTTDYLLQMKQNYQNSVDKPYIEGEVDTDRKLGKRLTFPHDALHWELNFPYEKYRVLDNSLNLTDEQLANFYVDWKGSFTEYLSNEQNLFPYTEKQIEIISQKMQKVTTPFLFKYDSGWEYLKIGLLHTIHLFFMFLAFILCEGFSKNGSKGIDKVTLSTKESRRKLISYKLGAACVFSTIAYFVYIAVVLLFITAVYTLHGWDSSVQIGTITFYSMNQLKEGLLYIAMGYFSTLVVTHLILFLSVVFKRGKLVLALSLIYFYLVNTYQMGRGALIEKVMVFMPQNFINNLIGIENLYFVGNTVFPYVFVALFLGTVYILLSRIGISIWMRRYYLQ